MMDVSDATKSTMTYSDDLLVWNSHRLSSEDIAFVEASTPFRDPAIVKGAVGTKKW